MLKFKLIQISYDFVLLSNEMIDSSYKNTWCFKNHDIINSDRLEKLEEYPRVVACTLPIGGIAKLDKEKIYDLILDRSYSLRDVLSIQKQFKNQSIDDYNFRNHLLNISKKGEWNAKIDCSIIKSNVDIFEAKVGDYILNHRGQGGRINKLDDDVRVEIDDYIEFAQTSNNGHETLNICGYYIIDGMSPKIDSEYISILSLD